MASKSRAMVKGKGKPKVNVKVAVSARGPKRPKSRRQSGNHSSQVMRYSESTPIKGQSGLHISGSSSSGSGLTVNGKEFFRDVSTSSSVVYSTFTINPSNILLFPKLQSLGLLFEEFYIRGLSVCYHPACPTTRSGSISFCIDYDPADAAPSSILALMANSTSVTVGVGQRASVPFNPPAQRTRWYYTTGSVGSDINDIRQVSPGNLQMIVSNSTSGDAGLIAGYLEVSYSIEFRTMKPPPELFLTSGSSQLTVLQPSAAYTDLGLALQNSIGYTGLTGNSQIAQGPGGTNESNSVILQAGVYVLSYLWNWLAAGVTKNDRYPRRQTASVKSFRAIRQGVSSLSLSQGSEEKKVLEAYVPVSKKKAPFERKEVSYTNYIAVEQRADGSWWGECPDGTWVLMEPEMALKRPDTPLAIGDCIFLMQVRDMVTAAQYSFDVTTILGSGVNNVPVSYSKALTATILTPQCLVCQFNNADSRALSAFEFSAASAVTPE